MKQYSGGFFARRGVWGTVRQLLRRYDRHAVGRSSAALTYYLVFAAFPLLVFFSTLLGALEVDGESVLRLGKGIFSSFLWHQISEIEILEVLV